ncbi:MAG: hypothetical protein FJ087_13595 [Deltaproteobacteria bacterium]|nr:hypothetical protein [Deltaproteobacteria bacterium]
MTAGAFLRLTALVDAALCAVALVAAAVFGPGDWVVGIAAGGALGAANLLSLGWLCGRLLGGEGRKWPYGVLLGCKFAVLVTLVWAAIRFMPMDVVAFVIGLSASGVAIVSAAGFVAVRNVELTT